ncbi:MAG: FAD-binding protein [Betaproteobacteria bacterium]|nr:FAD-binding protein [Betaproteobacteria bacterium]
MTSTTGGPVIVAGGGIGGLAAALALVRQGFEVLVLERAPEIGEIGAGIQLGPNAFHAFDALGVGDKARSRAVYTDCMVMHDAIDESLVGRLETGEAFRQRFGNPYAVIHRADVHLSLLEGAQETGRVQFLTNTRLEEQWGVTEGSKEEVQSYFQGISPLPRQLIDLPKSWKRWATADREPIGQWSFGRVTLLGDAAHPTTQYMAQGACMAMEDAVTLGEALRVHGNDWAQALDLYQRARVARTARIVLSGREMGRIYHAMGVERLVRNSLWKGRTQERFYDAVEWLYSWNVNNCLSAAQ